MSFIEKKIPPPIVMLAFGFLMYLVHDLMPALHFRLEYKNWISIIIITFGAFIGASSVWVFWKNKTTINPHKPDKTTTLVNTGVFLYSRNPMYLCLVFMLIAWGVYLSSIFALIFILGFVLYINQYQIKPEENALSMLFGEEYELYKKSVRRWL